MKLFFAINAVVDAQLSVICHVVGQDAAGAGFAIFAALFGVAAVIAWSIECYDYRGWR